MNKSLWQILITISFLLVSCAPSGTSAPVIVEKVTYTSSPPPTNTIISVPTETLTASVTRLPTIPTFTPTFDASTIVTVTPAPKAECPQVAKIENPDLSFFDFSFEQQENRAKAEENILNFLNNYGPLPLVEALQKQGDTMNEDYALLDLTNDDVQEFAVRAGAFYIFGCHKGIYETLLILPPDGYLTPPNIVDMDDVNANNIPDITFRLTTGSQGGRDYQIYEWDGNVFKNLLTPYSDDYPNDGTIYVMTTGNIAYNNIDSDRAKELIVIKGIPIWSVYIDGLPWRNETQYYKWDGNHFVFYANEFATPEFRFQALQDGDRFTLSVKYDQALEMYQQTIFSDKLEWWSPERRLYLRDTYITGENESPNIPPQVNASEYYQLATYAYYRIMLLYIVQGHESDAGTVYKTLQQKFGNDPYGSPYVEMATAFWNAYQATHKMYDSCAAAIQYAAEHPEILVPLGSDYHGAQSHIYVPADVCPFR